MLRHFHDLSDGLSNPLSDYAAGASQARGLADSDPLTLNGTAAIAKEKLKVAVSGHLHGFDK